MTKRLQAMEAVVEAARRIPLHSPWCDQGSETCNCNNKTLAEAVAALDSIKGDGVKAMKDSCEKAWEKRFEGMNGRPRKEWTWNHAFEAGWKAAKEHK